MAKNTKLELTWIGKDKRPRLEPRVLVEDTTKSYHASVRHGADDIFDNMLIHGDNLLALKALEQKFAGQVKCIYIDPPYNTGSAFEHYDDGLEHSIWLGLMRERLLILRDLLREDGYIFVQIDDHEMPYLTVIMDEVFRREMRVNIIAVKMSESSGVKMAHVNKRLPKKKEFVLLYKKSEKSELTPIRVEKGEDLSKYLKYYSKIIVDKSLPCEKWQLMDLKSYLIENNMPYDDESIADFKIKNAERMVYRTNNKSLSKLAKGVGIEKVISSTGITYISWDGKQMLFLADYIREYTCDLWLDISTINLNKEGGVDFPDSKKPEKLIERCLTLTTQKGDLILDSFLGSGTTAAVAHKMGRRWIGIELGDHCYTHCLPRLKSVVDGTDQSGISKFVNWQGGGGYRFYELAPTLIKEDAFGQKVINKEYRPEMLAEAVCKLEGFVYAPSTTEYFIHGHSTERDFIYVTTNTLKPEHLVALNDRVGDDRTLLVCCKAFTKGNAKLPRLTVKKIPKAVLDKCEYGHDDYSLNVKNLPMAAKPLKQGELAL